MDPALPTAHNLDVSIAGLSFSVEADRPLRIDPNFAPFVTGKAVDCCCRAVIQPSASISGMTGKLICKDFDYDVYQQKDGSFSKAYRLPYKDGYYAESYQKVPGECAEVRWLEEKMPKVLSINDVFHTIGWEQMLLWNERLLLHAACVDTKYGGILFSGPSGVGKSTQEQLWKDYRGARGINGDRPVLYRKDCWRAYGSPMAGSSGEHFNESVPIRAIVMLQQGDENTIRKLSLKEAYQAIYTGTTVYIWEREYVERALSLVLALVSEIPVYRLTCTPDERAVLTLEAVLNEECN